jgi:hypothetical protein
MAKYLLLYRGPASDPSSMSAEQQAEMMDAWTAWTGKVATSITDQGNPFGNRTAVSDSGGSTTPADLNGYTIVEAESLAAAEALTDGHPFLSEGKGRFAIDIFELAPM